MNETRRIRMSVGCRGGDQGVQLLHRWRRRDVAGQRETEVRNVLSWHGAADCGPGPVLEVHAVVDRDRPSATALGLTVPGLVFDTEDFPNLAHHAREFTLAGASLLLAGHDTTHSRT